MMDEQTILKFFKASTDLMNILRIIRDLKLKDSWLAAGSVRNFIWNILSNQPGFDADTDVDVIFFDPTVSYEATVQIEEDLKKQYPQYKWEVKNQVYMHIHSPGTKPYTRSKDAMSKYPERCTAIGLRLLEDEKLDLFTAYGLDEIVRFQVYPTPHFIENKERMVLYTERLKKKDWQRKWPQLTFHFPEK